MLGRVFPLSLFAKGEPRGDGEAGRPAAGLETSRGRCWPLGATVVAGGVNFAVFSRHAEAVTLVLYEEGAGGPVAEVALEAPAHRTGDVWHVLVHGLGAGALYGYRAAGPVSARQGHRFNPRAVLLDPYARSVSGPHPWGAAPGEGRPARLGRVEADDFDWEGDAPPNTPLARTVIYEMHVRGFTRHPSSGVAHPGTYLGVCEKIGHLRSLGVTAVQLMPVQEFDERSGGRGPLTGAALANYWGYSPVSFVAPKEGYATGPGRQGRELKEMVKRLHAAGIEVILDVVFNHTAEGDERGPALGLRGLDNAVYYLLDREGRYLNYSGCGNTVNANHPAVAGLVVDALVHLVAEYHVDGFRFDLAGALARGPGGPALEEPPLLRQIAGHPALAGVKLIAEAWDAAGLNLQGKFGAWGRWSELNGPFRDDVRRWVRGDLGASVGLAKRLCGSLDLFGGGGRGPWHSVNFVTCHDGFTLRDLVSYDRKHNEANGENNRDGWDHNFSDNCGVEGPTDHPPVVALRGRQVRNFLVALLAAQGVPLLLMGDEMGRTQGGNNNAYCQDNETSWLDWGLAEANAGLLRFTRMMVALRQRHLVAGREEFAGRVTWGGAQVGEPDWTGHQRALAMHLAGEPSFYFLFNAQGAAQRFALPRPEGGRPWRRVVDTSLPSPEDIVEESGAVAVWPGDHYLVTARTTVVLVS